MTLTYENVEEYIRITPISQAQQAKLSEKLKSYTKQSLDCQIAMVCALRRSAVTFLNGLDIEKACDLARQERALRSHLIEEYPTFALFIQSRLWEIR